MKELISAAIMIVSVFYGTQCFHAIHKGIQKAALEKVAQGLPSLTAMTASLQKRK